MDRLNARLDEALARKLTHLRRMTGQSVTAIVHAALELYYDTVSRGDRNAKSVLTRNGFVGCTEGDPELSSRYKPEMTDSMRRKT